MKKRLLLIVPLAVMLVACTQPQQKVAYNTLYSVGQTTDTALTAFYSQVVAGKVPTNAVPKVSSMYNHFNMDFTLALDAVQYNTNALAPASLLTESKDLINVINSLTGNGK